VRVPPLLFLFTPAFADNSSAELAASSSVFVSLTRDRRISPEKGYGPLH